MRVTDILRSLFVGIMIITSVRGRSNVNRSRAGIATWILATIIIGILAVVFYIALVTLVFAPSPTSG